MSFLDNDGVTSLVSKLRKRFRERPSTWYGSSQTAASTSTKVVDCDGFALEKGAIIAIWFQQNNSANTVRLNINGTGAYALFAGGSSNGLWFWSQSVVTVQFTGVDYRLLSVANNVFNHPVLEATWSNKAAASTVGTYVELGTFTVSKGKWLILMQNGNGQGSAVKCNVNATVSSGTGTLIGGLGFSDDTSGNVAVGYAYVNATTAVTITVRTYTYNTAVTNFNGGAVAIRIA